MRKFEEGVFTDLRILRSGVDAITEEPPSPFLHFLYRNNCIRSQKKQKVFYWYSVPHDRIFLDALERDLRREVRGEEPYSVAVDEPAVSFEWDRSSSLFETLVRSSQISMTTMKKKNLADLHPTTNTQGGSTIGY